MPRPLIHDLLRSVIDILGATVDSIVVCDLKNDMFYARIILNVNGHQTEIDSRSSDAMALAAGAKVPIFVEEAVLAKAGIMLNTEIGKPFQEEGETHAESKNNTDKGKKVSSEDLKKMSAWSDFINTLDLKDFDNCKS